jgi:hypothetical protein
VDPVVHGGPGVQDHSQHPLPGQQQECHILLEKNGKRSTAAELGGADDAATQMLWTLLFMEAQGFEITHNILYQDNKSVILLEKNGKRSSSKRTRALNIRYFFLTDQVAKGNLQIEYESTMEMWGDFMSKPLQGKLFRKFKALIMGHGD